MGRSIVPTAAILAVCASLALADLVTSPKEHVALKKQLHAARYEGVGFATERVYELQGRLSGMISSDSGTDATIQTSTHSLHLRLASVPKGVSAGAQVRALVRMNNAEGVLEALSIVSDRAANALDPDPEPAPPPAETDLTAQADPPASGTPEQPPTQVPASKKAPQSVAAVDWVDYFSRLAQYFNPRLDNGKARIIAANILYQSAQWQVDPFLIVAVIASESRFNPSAVSRRGAMGLAQLMPSTARGMGLTNPYSVEQNIYAGVRIIKGHLERHTRESPWDQFSLALASYNAGSGAVRKFGGVPPYKETRNYILKVYGTYKALRDAIGG